MATHSLAIAILAQTLQPPNKIQEYSINQLAHLTVKTGYMYGGGLDGFLRFISISFIGQSIIYVVWKSP